jgi:stage IV sporulation protein B
MKKLAITAMAVLSIWLLPGQAMAAALIPVGQVMGIEVSNDQVCVADFDGKFGQAARDAGLQVGDEILQIDGVKIDSAADVRTALQRSDGQVELRVLRKNKELRLNMGPVITENGPRLGVLLRQGVTGIGTVTYYDPATKKFGSLGHGVSSPDGELAQMSEGKAYSATVISVVKGKAGQPGQLRGGVGGGKVIGKLERNTHQGLFGTVQDPWQGRTMETAQANEIKCGKATILSTVSGNETQEYSVEILKLYPQNRAQGRNMLLRVTDQRLLQTTGGIVQGMSGSPIIQDGKLVGAVTHVLVNDPTMGYGIFIENMLDAAA